MKYDGRSEWHIKEAEYRAREKRDLLISTIALIAAGIAFLAAIVLFTWSLS